LGNGNGTFPVQQPLSVVGEPLAAGDLNGDGKPDLIIAPSIEQPGANTVQSLLNNESGLSQSYSLCLERTSLYTTYSVTRSWI